MAPVLAEAAARPWPDGFHPFTPHHWLSSIAFVAIALTLVYLGGKLRGTPRELAIRGGIVGAMIVSQALMLIYWAEPERFTWAESMPLHMCDIVAWMVPFALITNARWLATIVFFWGLGLTTQAFIQPTLLHGLRHGVYWFFWVQHAGILLGGLYVWWVQGYRPRTRDLVFIAGLSALAGAVTAVVNWQTGWSYFFTGPATPENETIIDHLGPWPLRVLWMWVISVSIMSVLLALSKIAARLTSTTYATNQPAPSPEA